MNDAAVLPSPLVPQLFLKHNLFGFTYIEHDFRHVIHSLKFGLGLMKDDRDSDPDPLILDLPDQAYFSGYHVNKLKIISFSYSILYIYISTALVTRNIYLPL